jgi:hypothetical protein
MMAAKPTPAGAQIGSVPEWIDATSQADIRHAEIRYGDDHQIKRVDRQTARIQRRKKLCPR